MNFDLNINVQIGVTSQLATFLTALLQNTPTNQVRVHIPATDIPTPEAPAPEAPAESEKSRRTRRAKSDAPEAAAEEVSEQRTEPKPTVVSSAQQAEKSHGEMIREIMHRTRRRFEGEDYKENTESEAYKKYHRALTAQFKQIAISLGYEKPSCIDTPEKVKAFATECDALIIDEKGFIAPPPAPF